MIPSNETLPCPVYEWKDDGSGELRPVCVRVLKVERVDPEDPKSEWKVVDEECEFNR